MSEKDFDFDRLIWPMEAANFFSDYWEKRPLIISRTEPDYYSNLFSMQDLESVICFTKPSVPKIRIFKNGQADIQSYLNCNGSPRINQLYDVYFKGNSINLNELQDSWEPIAILCRNLEIFFNHKVSVNMYLTPQYSQGFSPHFDTQEAFILQIEGAKLWRIYDSFLSLPMVENQQPVPGDKLGEPLHEVHLHAGDLLYIPRGYVHEALTSECSSLHLTVGIYPFRLADLISSAIALVSKQNVSLRKSLPVGFLNHGETLPSLKHQFKEALELLSNSATFEDALVQLTEQFFMQMTQLPNGHFTQIDDINSIDIETIVEKRNSMLCHILKEEDSVSIQFPGNIVRGPSRIEPALRFITDSRKFPIKSIPDILTENEKLVLVRRLVREGLLTIVQKE